MTIIVELAGGLGNQLFQYAFGRSLTLAGHGPVKFDARGYPDSSGRKFELRALKTVLDLASPSECAQLEYAPPGLVDRVLRRLGVSRPFVRSASHRREREWFKFDQTALEPGGEAYYAGFWQSPRYFERFRDVLLDEIQPVALLSLEAATLRQAMAAEHSVSVHIRRGDYRQPLNGERLWDVCGRAYYANGVAILKERAPTSTFYLFSDEPSESDADWFPGPTVIVPASIGTVESLALMSACQHHLIVNSSFSWWGAWLSRRAGTTVYPSTWMRGHVTSLDLIPAGWVRAEAPLE